jgi:hypothetical protein
MNQNQFLITRKSLSELRRRGINNSADKIIASAECNYGEEHSSNYLESAVRKAQKRKRQQIINDNKNAQDNEEENDENDEENDAIGEEQLFRRR